LLGLRRALTLVVCVYAVLFCWSIYRRIWQVMSIEARAPSRVIGPGARVGYSVTTSGEVPNLIRLELVQHAHSETLLERHARMGVAGPFDPRVFRNASEIALTPTALARFKPGPATLRVSGFGGMKLLRTPPTSVSEIAVTIVPVARD
jgi:hypothetical protein